MKVRFDVSPAVIIFFPNDFGSSLWRQVPKLLHALDSLGQAGPARRQRPATFGIRFLFTGFIFLL